MQTELFKNKIITILNEILKKIVFKKRLCRQL